MNAIVGSTYMLILIFAVVVAVLGILAPIFIYQIKTYTRSLRDDMRTANLWLKTLSERLAEQQKQAETIGAASKRIKTSAPATPPDPAILRAREILKGAETPH